MRGGSFYGVDATGRDLHRHRPRARSCRPVVGVEYGINVFQGTSMRIRNNTIEDPNGFGDAAIYIGGTPADADLRVERNTLTGPNGRGIIVEDSLDNPGRPVGVRVRKNEITRRGRRDLRLRIERAPRSSPTSITGGSGRRHRAHQQLERTTSSPAIA